MTCRRKGPYMEARRALIEDVEWMAETGECLTGAAERLGRNPEALATTLQRFGRVDLARTLRSREGNWMVTRTYRETA